MSEQALFSTVSFIVVEVSEESSRGLGQMQFRLAPRKGENITMNDENDQAQNYEVLAVIHPSEPAATAGDLLVRHTGSDVEFRQSLRSDFFVM